MKKKVEQRVCLKFCVANEISCTDALKMLQKLTGPIKLSTDENVDKAKKIVLAIRRVSKRENVSTLSISNGSVHRICGKTIT
ncbi:hypothetical protein ALC57_11483 [Trachymyrmex cornetzi]|uniref:Mos1 transposase HTH domain-containing protein n=1 Tax=Trachymyrmex cornetzi TaxID=471704 RepID=A0A195DU38_9HYME|nr:hypothetical protein ALC57_11483 [Trachymyrmex cornetzi]